MQARPPSESAGAAALPARRFVRDDPPAPSDSASQPRGTVRALVIDLDGSAPRLLFDQLSRGEDFKVESLMTESLADAATMIRSADWDCLVITGASGHHEALEMLRGLEGGGGIGLPAPTVVLGPDAGPGAARTTLMAGAQEYLAADELSAPQLLRAISLAIERVRLRLTQRGLRDPLTDLPGRLLFMDRVSRALTRAQRERTDVLLALIDLDDFKAVNDRYGHADGDLVLIATAERLGGLFRQTDTISRLGGDEFAAVCEGVDLARNREIIAERVTAALSTPVSISERVVSVGASVGTTLVSAADVAEWDPDQLLRRADEEMYRVKRGEQAGAGSADPTTR